MMRVLVIGGTGLIGAEVVKELGDRHEVITAGLNNGDIKVDIQSKESINNMFEQIGNIDAVVSTTGKVVFKSMESLSEEDHMVGINNKLMGQINLSKISQDYLNDNGSITLTSGILNIEPIFQGVSAAMVNGAIDGFVTGASIEMPRGIRINVVSPTVVKEAMGKYASYFRGYKPVTVADVALAYSKSVEGRMTGKVIKAGY
ncbi:short chain dehydrogenase [Francisellaceae bacterium]|nr:short chain dehydrogenase [Francisellaceae bacterium]